MEKELEFTIGGFKFTDITSYSRGDNERIPNTYETKVGDIRIFITNGHRDYRPDWIFGCYALGFDKIVLKNCNSKEDAAEYAVKRCRQKVTDYYNILCAVGEKI